MHRDAIELAIGRLRGMVWIVLFGRGATRVLVVAAFVLGTAVAALRASGLAEWLDPAWIAALLGGTSAAGGFVALRRTPSRSNLRAMLDRHCNCGGLLMACAEADAGTWKGRLGHLAIPAVKWRGGRTCLVAGLSIAFLGGCFLVPQKYFASPRGPLEVGGRVRGLEEKIDILAGLKVLEPPRAEKLRQGLERVAEQASGTDPSRTREALDHLAQAVQDQVDEAAEQAGRAAKKAHQGRALAEALAEVGHDLGPDRLGEAMETLADLARAAILDRAALEQGTSLACLDRAYCRGQAHGSSRSLPAVDPAALRECARLLARSGQEWTEAIGRLAEAGWIDPLLVEQALSTAMSCSGGGCGLAALLASSDEPVADLLSALAADHGGIARGPDSTLLTRNEPRALDEAFKEVVLPPAMVAREKSRLVGSSQADPAVEQGGAAAGGALAGARPGAGSAERAPVLPRHRKTVERFFERTGR